MNIYYTKDSLYDSYDEKLQLRELKNTINKNEIKTTDLLIELHYPKDISFSPYNKYLLSLHNEGDYSCGFTFLGQIQEKLFFKQFMYVNSIGPFSVRIYDFSSSICYAWFPKDEDFPFRLHGNTIILFMDGKDAHLVHKERMMTEGERIIMEMQPNYINYLQNEPYIIDKSYLDTLRKNQRTEF